MTKNKGMRIKDVGATINLGNYSSLHITIGEETEFAGLDLGRAETYLRKIAKSVDGVLNLPEKEDKPTEEMHPLPEVQDIDGNKMHYDHETHAIFDAKRECGLPPSLQRLFENDWNVETVYGEHCLQLNIYAYILEKVYGKKIKAIKIIHVPDGFKEIVDVPKVDITPIFQAYGAIR